MKVSKSEKQRAIDSLNGMLSGMPDRSKGPEWAHRQTLYTCVKHVSASGMQRQIQLLVPQADGSLRDATYAASKVLGWSIGKHAGVRVDGCGMDMCFHLVDCVMAALGKRCADWQKQYRLESL